MSISFSFHLTLWSWPHLTQLQISSKKLLRKLIWASVMKIGLKMWPLECYQALTLSSLDPISNSSNILVRLTIWASFIKIGLKRWPLECQQAFPLIWLSDTDPTWSNFEVVQDFIENNNLSKLPRLGSNCDL